MKIIKSLETIKEIVSKGEPLLIYFSGVECSVCRALKPKIEEEVTKNFIKMDIYEVKIESHKEIASYFSVFSIPTILVFFDSKEFFRESRNISIPAFIEKIRRPYRLFIN